MGAFVLQPFVGEGSSLGLVIINHKAIHEVLLWLIKSMQRQWVSLSTWDAAVHTNVRLLWVCLYASEGVSTWGGDSLGGQGGAGW